MKITAIKTKKFLPPKDDLYSELEKVVKRLKENSIICIASKIVSIGEGRCIPFSDISKDELVRKEADQYLERDQVPNSWMMHAIKNNLLIGAAGIDESNGDGYYILWPENPDQSAERIYHFLKEKGLKNIGVIITDSHSIPMRRGLIGISLSYFGFEPLRDYMEEKDLFDRELVLSMTNIPDSLAASSVFVMGEGAEQTPIAVIEDLEDYVKFTSIKWQPTKPNTDFSIKPQDDLYAPFLKSVPWKKGQKN
jgi:dihydrofolate synthase / folylpolyglutamate synthase